ADQARLVCSKRKPAYGLDLHPVRFAARRLLPRRLGPGQDRPPGRAVAGRGAAPRALVARPVPADGLRLLRGLRYLPRRRSRPLGALTVPAKQRHFAQKTGLPTYAAQIADLRKQGAKLVTVFGIGRVCHIAFWEPHFAAEFAGVDDWRKQTHRLGARLHPLTIEQNALTSFRSRTTLVPAFANTIGPALFLSAERIIGGAD